MTLTNEETVSLTVNFLTIKMVMESGMFKKHKDFFDRMSEKEKNEKSDDENISKSDEGSDEENYEDNIATMSILGKFFWCVLYSNGKKVPEEDALALIPVGGDDTIWEMLDEFTVKAEQFRKNMAARANMMKITK